LQFRISECEFNGKRSSVVKKVWIHKTDSFKAADKFDEEYYLNMTSKERLEIMQMLREIYYKFSQGKKRENRKGLQRSIKIIQRA